MNVVRAVKGGVDVALRVVVIVLFAAMIALVAWQVFVRQVLHAGSSWTEVLARVVFIWQGLIGAAYVIGEKDDVAIDWLVRKFRPGVSRAVMALAHAIVGGFAVWIMVWGGSLLVRATWGTTVQLLPVNQGVVYSAVPAAGALIAFYTIIHIVEIFADPDSAGPPGDQVPDGQLPDGQLPEQEAI